MVTTLHVPDKIINVIERRDRSIVASEVATQFGLSGTAAEEYLGRLAREGRLARRGPGIFTAPRGGRPRIEPTSLLKRVGTALRRDLPTTPVVGWSTEWLADYSPNVPTRHWTVLETASFALDSVADVLARDRIRVVVDPEPSSVADLPRLFDHPVLLWPHADLYGAPPRTGVRLPQPERLLVDLYFAVTRRGLPYPQNDLSVVIARVIAERDLKVASILAYAARRGIADEVTTYLRSLPRLPADVAEAIGLVAARVTLNRSRA
jgi:hypothetical protein